MDAQSLIVIIFEAFPTEPMPAMTLRQGQLADQSLSRAITDQEWDREGERDRHIIWTDISDSVLQECEAALSHFDEDAFVYYLPAFLRLAVTNIHANVLHPLSAVVGSTLFAVTERSNYNLGRLKRLTDKQIDCIIEFLRFDVEQQGACAQEAEKSLTRYWLTQNSRVKTIVHLP
jgi:hypothetical protein